MNVKSNCDFDPKYPACMIGPFINLNVSSTNHPAYFVKDFTFKKGATYTITSTVDKDAFILAAHRPGGCPMSAPAAPTLRLGESFNRVICQNTQTNIVNVTLTSQGDKCVFTADLGQGTKCE